MPDRMADIQEPAAAADSGDSLVFMRSSWRTLIILVLLAALAGLMIVLGLRHLPRVWLEPLALATCLAGYIIYLAAQLLHRGPLVVVDSVGIEDKRWPFGIIAWEDICAIKPWRNNRHQLTFEMVNTEEILSTLPRFSRWWRHVWSAMGVPPIRIDFTGLTPDPQRLIDFAHRQRESMTLGGQCP